MNCTRIKILPPNPLNQAVDRKKLSLVSDSFYSAKPPSDNTIVAKKTKGSVFNHFSEIGQELNGIQVTAKRDTLGAQKLLTQLLTRSSGLLRLQIVIHLAENSFEFSSAHSGCLIEGFRKDQPTKIQQLFITLKKVKFPLNQLAYTKLINFYYYRKHQDQLQAINEIVKISEDIVNSGIAIDQEFKHFLSDKLTHLLKRKRIKSDSEEHYPLNEIINKLRIKSANKEPEKLQNFKLKPELILEFRALSETLPQSQAIPAKPQALTEDSASEINFHRQDWQAQASNVISLVNERKPIDTGTFKDLLKAAILAQKDSIAQNIINIMNRHKETFNLNQELTLTTAIENLITGDSMQAAPSSSQDTYRNNNELDKEETISKETYQAQLTEAILAQNYSLASDIIQFMNKRKVLFSLTKDLTLSYAAMDAWGWDY